MPIEVIMSGRQKMSKQPRRDNGSGPPLTVDQARGVRFSRSRPSGYFFPQVETFVTNTIAALQYHEDHDFEKNKQIHVLREELADAEHRAATLQTQIELFRVQGDVLVNDDGTYVTESQTSSTAECDELRLKLADAEATIATYMAHAEATETYKTEVMAFAEAVEARAVEASRIVADAEARITVAEETARQAVTRLAAAGNQPPLDTPIQPIADVTPPAVAAAPPTPDTVPSATAAQTAAQTGAPATHLPPATILPERKPLADTPGPSTHPTDQFNVFEESPHLAAGSEMVHMFSTGSELPEGTIIPPHPDVPINYRYYEATPGSPLRSVPADEVPELSGHDDDLTQPPR